MLCKDCRRRLPRRGDACPLCGAPRPGATARPRYSVVLADGTRAPVRGELSVGRAAGNRLRLDDRAVSRRHARLVEDPAGVGVHDLGSSSGTFVRGHRVTETWLARDGELIRAGDTYLRVERERGDDEAGRTIVVPVNASLRIGAVAGRARIETASPLPARPRLRSGWKLKRLDRDEGTRRYVLADLRGDGFLHFTQDEARLLQRLDGRRTVAEIVDAVERELGADQVVRLAELIAELGERGLLAGAAPPAPAVEKRSLWRRLFKVRELSFAGGADRIDAFYRRLAYVLYTRVGLAAIAAVALVGAVAFANLVASGDVRPFRVADNLGLGALAFITGRLAVVALHELSHALTLASFGRRPRRVGLKLVGIFPYAFVDTSEVWFESRPRRIAVAAAGPIADISLAGAFSLAALATHGVTADIAYQLALGAYLGTVLNLNPLLDRDGYQILADLVRQPGLRRRARERLAGRRADGAPSRAVRLYAVGMVCSAAIMAAVTAVAAMRVVGPMGGAAAGALALTPTALIVARRLRPAARLA
jgi:putative peptide zinc metalloprotease protein